VRGPDGQIDNILRLHSLRPHTLESHLALYKSALHHTGNRLPSWLLEAVGTYVSLLNGCDYCLEHHFEGLRRLVADDQRAGAMRGAMETGDLAEVFDDREVEILCYAERLTRDPAAISGDDVERLRAVGLRDGEILEVNQVTAYFAYANRTVQGLGGTTEGEVLGLSPDPSDDLGDWEHG
jgi:uncharacterized peroxidase-related enzyme